MGFLTLKTEYSFGECYGFIQRLMDEFSDDGFIGIADKGNTFAFHRLRQACNKHNDSIKDAEDYNESKKNMAGSKKSTAKKIKPIFGIRLTVLQDATIKVKPRGSFGTEYIIISKNKNGLKEIFKLTSIDSSNFYYRGNISTKDIENLSDNVFVIPTSNIITNRVDYMGINLSNRDTLPVINNKISHMGRDIPIVVIDNNFYPTINDRDVYELFSGRNREKRTVCQYILTENEKKYYYEKEFIDNIKIIADQCEDYQLPKGETVKSIKGDSFIDLIIEGAEKKNIDLSKEPYKSRIKREIDIITEKEFVEYFLVVGDIVRFAKEKSLVGPGRGCFTKGHLVKTIDGYKSIEDIEIFDKVFDAYGNLETCKNVFEYDCNEDILEIELENGIIIKCTMDHKILTKNGFVKAMDLNEGDDVNYEN